MLFEDSGRNGDVVLQWIDRDYLVHKKKEYSKKYFKEESEGKSRKERKLIKRAVISDYEEERKELERIVVGPDEYAVVLKDGKVDQMLNQQQVRATPGFWGKVAEAFSGGTKDIQIMLVDTRKHSMKIPFEAFTKDKVAVRGYVDLFACINTDDIPLALRLIREAKGYSSKPGFRQVTVSDISDVIKANLDYIIDTESIAGMTAAELHDNRNSICLDLISALNAKTPYWANYGLAVNYSTIEFDENKFEELERRDAENKLKIKELDLKAALAEAESADRVRLDDIMQRERALFNVSSDIAYFGAQVALSSAKKDLDVAKSDDESEVVLRARENQNRLEMMVAYHKKELRRIEDTEIDETEKKLRIAEIEARIKEIELKNRELDYTYDLKKRNDAFSMEQASKNNDLQREIQLMNAKTAATRALAADDVEIRKMEIAKGVDQQRQEAEIARARAEAEFAGYKAAGETAHSRQMESMEITKDMLNAANKGTGETAKERAQCSACGKRIAPGSKFCPSCGAPLGGGNR